jgi:two-component system, OmpR family, response regulator
MSLPKILVIDDDKENLELLSEFLRGRYEVETTSDPQAAIQSAIQSPPALAIIDIDMPIMNGFEVCETLRASGNCAQMAIVFLTSDAQAASMQRALKLGADDYVLKPFRVNDLLTRIEFRLAQAHVDPPQICGNLRLEPTLSRAIVRARGKDHVTRLTPQAFRVLQTLMRNEGRVLGRDQLLELAWQDEDASDRSVDLHVFRLRKLLAGWNYEIGTIYGKGYVIVPKSR